MTKLVDEAVTAFDVRPGSSALGGAAIAYIARNIEEEYDYTLKLLSLPDGGVRTVTPLLGETSKLEDPFNLHEAITADGLKWSPGGSLLAFVGALNGNSIDVYTYDFVGGAITRLSDQPSHAYYLNWSPDGRYLVYQGFNFTGMMGAVFADIWAVKADGTGTSRLIAEADIKDDVYYKRWISSAEIALVNQLYMDEEESGDTRIINLETGKTAIILVEPFFDVAFAAEHNTWLLTASYTPEPEAPLILYRQGQKLEIPGQSIWHVQWLDTSDVFVGQSNQGIYTITADGQIMELPFDQGFYLYGFPHSLLVSPDKQSWAWYVLCGQAGESDLWIGKPLSRPSPILSTRSNLYDKNGSQIRLDTLHGITWSPDSRRLILLTFQGLHTVELPGLELVQTTNVRDSKINKYSK
ncbi:MAG: PD40 domain-containing protein [Anaerolineae bacterium]|nr:PD40 domain-containing protein [Anaerolineae bacterium]